MNEHIDPAQWQRLGALFDRAIELDAAGQAELLRSIEVEDAGLAQMLASLLAADATHHADATAQRERVRHVSLATIDVRGIVIGDRVGPYVLREALGQGGMGVVYRAERADGQVRQEVALKIVKNSLLDANGRERFLREREIVAAFQHPSIARLLDVGETADGSPYLAMELIRGLPITGWCDARKLDTRRRIEVFLRVCEAVQHAHANLVLHRDLKPNNVLVGDDGLPKLIDFGIAKPLTLMPESDRTTTRHRFFSPGNVAPEQLRGERVGVACDVYQLGTLLHELLCGASVFDAAGLTPGQFEQRILEMVPEPPSARAERASEATAFDHGAASASALARELRGDLDAIVALALRKLPAERYGSVEQFADDLQRWLGGRPVAAVRGQRWYRVRKFLRRNALAVGFAATVMLLIAGFMIALLMQSQRIARERDLAQQERDHAEHVAQFLTEVFKAADPAESLSRSEPIGTVLDNARKRLLGQLDKEPDQEVRMLGVLADVYTGLGDLDTASNLLDHAQWLVLSKQIDPRIVLGYDLDRARLTQASGNRSQQKKFANRALELQRSLGDSPGKQWEARVLLVDATYDPGSAAQLEARKALLRDLAREPDVPPAAYAEELVRLAQGYADANDTVHAESAVRQGLAGLQDKLFPYNPQVLGAKRLLATLLEPNHHRGEEGVTMLKDVIERENLMYAGPSTSVARSLAALGQVYSQLHRNHDAVEATQSACDMLHQAEARPKPDLPRCAMLLARAYEADGKLDPAASSYAEAAEVAAATAGDDSVDALTARVEEARVRMLQGRLDEAERMFWVLRPRLNLQAPESAAPMIYLADLMHRMQHDDEAVAALDSIAPLLKSHPDRLKEQIAAAAALRRNIASGK